jgi:hypothetical protein
MKQGANYFRLRVVVLGALMICVTVSLIVGVTASARSALQTSPFRIGEKLTYQVSFGKFANAGFAELQVVSRGKMSGKRVVELRSRIKTLEFVSATFFQLDEARTVYADPDTGLPLYIVKTANDGPLPKETISNYLSQPTQSFDLLTVIYKARENGGNGTYPLFENDQSYTATFVAAGAERIKTDAGEFDTVISTVTSDFLAVNGIKELKINFSVDEAKVPVLIRFKTAKGEVKAHLASIALPEPEATPTPATVATRMPTPTPRQTPTPDPYVDNQPLASELGFQVGEQLEYQVSSGGKPVGTIVLAAQERKQFEKQDSLLLTATVTGVEQGSRAFNLGDSAKVQVDPETLAPKWMESRFPLSPPGLNQTVTFDPRTGRIKFGTTTVDAPIGTHTPLSVIYAMRSFNLKPSKNLSNPVNDTRVAVFWESRPYIFTLRPSNPAEIVVNGEKVPAQLISVSTGNPGNPQLEALQMKVWLSTEERVPVRFSFGTFQADLISRTSNLSK